MKKVLRCRILILSFLLAGWPLRAFAAEPVSLNWLGGTPPAVSTGVSWGVPWPRGTVQQNQGFTLTGADGTILPLQTWPLAYWPDGSLKWSGFATVAGQQTSDSLKLSLGATPTVLGKPTIQLREDGQSIEIDTGRCKTRLPKQGSVFLDSMTIGGRVVAREARLVCTLEDRSELESNRTIRLEDFVSQVKKVTAEQSGPVRAVVKIEGIHKAEKGKREWLPFTLRLYFYAGQEAVRLVHTVVFDGDEQKDFIRGLGMVFAVPMREQVHNRHLRFSGEATGLWAEPLQPLTGRRMLSLAGRGNVYADQLAGRRIPNREEFDAAGQKLMADWATWDAFKLVQSTADGFTIQKRTNPQSSWLDGGAGRRAAGLVFAGDVSGGLTVAVKNFWQSYPASLEVQKATTDSAELQVWLWSPDAAPMDLRHYDTKAHDLDSSYEDVQPGFSTPHGIARTSELTLLPGNDIPPKQQVVQQAQMGGQLPLLVCTPQYLHSVRVFGIWSLPDRSSPLKRSIEEQLDNGIAFYQKEVEQRHWYGFWNYGDVMHGYDAQRHTWRYDIGGFAWDNTELGTDLWLWYSFLRTGRADIFRMAEAMTRHTSEVDVYHLGRFAKLGSRHNVSHWGCGAKEIRISQAPYRRFYYYLTTDERTGDLMREVVDADYTLTKLDPMRLARPLSEMPSSYPARIRGGPDWLAAVGNWMTEWERTGNTKYRDKILAGMDSISKFPYGFLSGPENLYGYDPATGKLYTLAADPFGTYNLTSIMGGAQVVFELNEIIDHPGWHKAWLQYCRLQGAPKDVVARDMISGSEGSDGAYAGGGRLAAYAFVRTKNPAFATRAWAQVQGRGEGARRATAGPMFSTRRVEGPDVLNPIDESPGVSTNNTAQWSLNAIEVLEMCASQMPEPDPERPGRAGR